jgi:hypothetical protein
LTDERAGDADVRTVGQGLEDLARTLHASYLNRWGRHDPAGLERQTETTTDQGATAGRTTAA